jgi:hypothetical protein
VGWKTIPDVLEDELELLEDELEDELLEVELEVPGNGSPGQEPVEPVAGQVEPETLLHPTVQRTVVVSSSIPLPKESSMIRLTCLLGACTRDGRDTVRQVDQPPVGANRLPNVPTY